MWAPDRLAGLFFLGVSWVSPRPPGPLVACRTGPTASLGPTKRAPKSQRAWGGCKKSKKWPLVPLSIRDSL
jgi:hypothetical protein